MGYLWALKLSHSVQMIANRKKHIKLNKAILLRMMSTILKDG